VTTAATPGLGCIFARGDGAGPEVFTALAEVTSIGVPGMKLDTIDVTTLEDDWRVFLAGLKDAGEVTLGLNYLPGNATQQRLQMDLLDPVVRNYRIEWSDASVAAHMHTGVILDNNAITWTAVRAGAYGNGITVTLSNPGGSGAISVAVVGKAITVTLGRTAGTITSTATDVCSAIVASAAASALVTTANNSTSDGSGVVTAETATPLADGIGTRWTLPAVVSAFGATGDMESELSATATLKISGAPTLAGVS